MATITIHNDPMIQSGPVQVNARLPVVAKTITRADHTYAFPRYKPKPTTQARHATTNKAMASKSGPRASRTGSTNSRNAAAKPSSAISATCPVLYRRRRSSVGTSRMRSANRSSGTRLFPCNSSYTCWALAPTSILLRINLFCSRLVVVAWVEDKRSAGTVSMDQGGEKV